MHKHQIMSDTVPTDSTAADWSASVEKWHAERAPTRYVHTTHRVMEFKPTMPVDYSKHTASEDSREGCAGDDDERRFDEGAGAVVVPLLLGGVALLLFWLIPRIG
jgi:hypothetical protein